MRPHQRYRRARRSPQIQAAPRPVGLVPHLFRQQLTARRELFVTFNQRANIVARRQFVMRAFARQQGPHPSLAPSLIRPAVRSLPVAVPVVTQPSRPILEIALQYLVHHPQRIHNQRIIGPPHAVTHEFKEASVDDLPRFKLNLRARRPVRQPNHFLAAILVRVHLATPRRPYAHVVPLDFRIEHAPVRHRPVFEVPFNPVGKLLKKRGQLVGFVGARNLRRANQSANHRSQCRRRVARILLPAILFRNRRTAHQAPRCTLNERKNRQIAQPVPFPQSPCQDQRKRHLVQLLAGPIGSAVNPEVLRKAAIGQLRACEVHQRSPRRLDASAGQQRRRRLHHVTRPHQVVAAQVVVTLHLAPWNRCRRHKRA